MSELNYWNQPLSPCGDFNCRDGLRPVHYGDEHEWDICSPCEARAVFAQEAQRREDEAAARRLWAAPVELVHPNYPF